MVPTTDRATRGEKRGRRRVIAHEKAERRGVWIISTGALSSHEQGAIMLGLSATVQAHLAEKFAATSLKRQFDPLVDGRRPPPKPKLICVAQGHQSANQD